MSDTDTSKRFNLIESIGEKLDGLEMAEVMYILSTLSAEVAIQWGMSREGLLHGMGFTYDMIKQLDETESNEQ